MSQLEIWTDGSGTASGPCGWAAILRWVPDDGEVVEREHCGQIAEGTNNVAEMTAVLEGLRALTRPCKVTVVTDSEYVMRAFTDAWLGRWRANGWKTSAKKPVANQELWLELEAEVAKHQVEWRHVRGHTGHKLNERCDELAGEQRRLAIEAVSLFDPERVAA